MLADNIAPSAPPMKGKSGLPTPVQASLLAAAIIAAVWLLLEAFSRAVGLGFAAGVALLLFGVSVWGLLALRRK